MKPIELGPRLIGLAGAMRYKLPPEAADVWLNALKEYSLVEVDAAFAELSNTCDRMPAPSQARELIRANRAEARERKQSAQYAEPIEKSAYGQACAKQWQRFSDGDIDLAGLAANIQALSEKWCHDLPKGEK